MEKNSRRLWKNNKIKSKNKVIDNKRNDGRKTIKIKI